MHDDKGIYLSISVCVFEGIDIDFGDFLQKSEGLCILLDLLERESPLEWSPLQTNNVSRPSFEESVWVVEIYGYFDVCWGGPRFLRPYYLTG